jgi:CDP-diacylglycerol--glycerol-3-phosphate 3-phosphatidyltransferase
MDFRRYLGQKITTPLVPFLSKLGLTPDLLTWMGLIINLAAAVVVACDYLLIGGILVAFSGFFDVFDGALARYTQKTTTFGALLDSTFDRISEAALLSGLMVYYFKSGDLLVISLLIVALIFSFLISYIRARAEGLGIDCKVGFFTRMERVIIVVIGLIFPTVLFFMIIILALLSFITVIQRLVYVYVRTKGAGKTS